MAILKWRFDISNESADNGVDPVNTEIGNNGQISQNGESPVVLTSTALLTTTLAPTVTSSASAAGSVIVVGDGNNTAGTPSNNISLVDTSSAEFTYLISGLHSVSTSTFTTTLAGSSPTAKVTLPGFDGQHHTPDRSASGGLSLYTTLATSRSSAIPSGTTNSTTASDHQGPSQNPLIPIVASVIPVAIILGIVLLILWRRYRKATHDRLSKSKDDAQRHDSALVANEKIEDQQNQDQNATTISPQIANAPHIQRSHKPVMIQIPPRRHPDQRTTTTSDPDDPFLTPTNQTTFSRDHEGSTDFRTSQIGLAVTTPPTLNQNHSRNASTTSLPSSILTVLHHATQRLSNPFRDPPEPAYTPTTIKQPSANSSVSPVPEEDRNEAHNEEPIVTTPESQLEPTTTAGRMVKSDTPPEELARRWIEVLKIEAAQAQEAAEEAARVAREMRLKQEQERRCHEEARNGDTHGRS